MALGINRATYCFYTSHSRSGTAESGFSVVYFWREQAQTATFIKRMLHKGMTVTTGRAVLPLGEKPRFHQ